MASRGGSSLFLASHVGVGLQVEFMSCTVYTVVRCLVGWNVPGENGCINLGTEGQEFVRESRSTVVQNQFVTSTLSESG